eukprot:Hpha_TRINITY_DN5555_c0_g1::TRINITY_DN5555_c0_g1_i1::g.93773::m.93773
MKMMSKVALALLGAVGATALSQSRVHLIDMYPRQCPDPNTPCTRNYLFRSNNPMEDKAMNFTKLVDFLRTAAGSECGVKLPESFLIVDVLLENPTDPGYYNELDFWKANPANGTAVKMMTLGSAIDPDPLSQNERDKLVASGKWAVEGDGDHLDDRLQTVNSMLKNVTQGAPKLFLAHCNAGCDRTGEFIGAYGMKYLGYNTTTMYGNAQKQCGRPPNYYATEAIKWYCLTLQSQGVQGLGDCLTFAGCKAFGDCDAHNPTPSVNPCPVA